jgi:hypothetical protein
MYVLLDLVLVCKPLLSFRIRSLNFVHVYVNYRECGLRDDWETKHIPSALTLSPDYLISFQFPVSSPPYSPPSLINLFNAILAPSGISTLFPVSGSTKTCLNTPQVAGFSPTLSNSIPTFLPSPKLPLPPVPFVRMSSAGKRATE